MNNFNNAYLSLSDQIDSFIDKYYRLMALKGALMVGVLSFFVFGAVIFLEQLFHFSTVGRSILFFGSCILIAVALLSQSLIPLAQSLNWYRRINYKKAAILISSFVPEIKDELINTIELEASREDKQNELLDASIAQKATTVLAFNFLDSFSFAQYKRYFISFLLVFYIALIGSVTFSDFIISPIKRVIQFQNNFLPENPFKFEINNGIPLIVLENENLDIKIKTIGKTDPQNLIIVSNGSRYFPVKTSTFNFKYQFNNINNNFTFFLKDGLGDTVNFKVTVLPKAKILEEKKVILYPTYTRIKNDTLKDLSSIVVPQGSSVYWEVKIKNTSQLEAGFVDTLFSFNQPSELCRFYYSPRKSQSYQLRVKNKYSNYLDSINYNIELEKDQYPTIYFEEFSDSSLMGAKYFLGKIADDYGFSRLNFVYKSSIDDTIVAIPISYERNNQSSFSFDIDFNTLSLSAGEKISYYFSVWDNDGINGPKETKSLTKILSIPNKSESRKEKQKKSLEKELALSSLQKNVASFNEDLKKIKADLLNKKKMDWNDKNNIQNFLKKQSAIQLELDELQEKMKKTPSFELDEKSEEIIKKQDLLNKMMEELMSDEMKKLYDELNKMVEEMNKDKVLDKIEDIDLSQENLIKELDRTIEHFKRLEVEQKAKDLAKDLEELSSKQDSLSNQAKNKKQSAFEKTKKQEKIKSDFYELKKELYELKKKNEELSSPKELDTKSEEQKIQKDMDNALDEISQNKNKKASKSQSSASEEMKKLSKKLNSLSKESQSQQAEDLASLRILLEQLLTFSIEQEDLLSALKSTSSKDPKYVAIGKNQRKLKDELRTIDDSLTALAKRQIMISNKINTEVQQIKRALNLSIKNLTERKNRTAQVNQQTVMMHTNELGLLLSEIMEQMQNQMPGNGQCNKPGGNNKKPGGSMPKSSDQLKKQIEAMKKFMEEKQNGNNPGGKGGSFEQLGRMAAEQAAIKKQLMEMAQEMNKDGSGKGNGLKKIIKDLEDVEEQIINNELDLTSVMRQEEIKIKLLELEKANKQQEEDKKRESKEVNEEYKKNNLELYNEYLKIKNGQLELLKSIPPNLKPYYKNKVNEYFKNIEKDYD